MALATHQMRGSHVTFPSRPSSWNKDVTPKHHVASIHMFGRLNRRSSMKCYLRSSVGIGVHGFRTKLLRVSSFQSSQKNNDASDRSCGSKGSKNSGETLRELPKAQSVPISCSSEQSERLAGSPAIHKIFKNWLNVLQSNSSCQRADGVLGEAGQTEELAQTQNIAIVTQPRSILLEAFHRFWQLNATIKIPILIFMPLYVAISMIYGVEVSKELTPLWILGPLVVAIYIKLLQAVLALYAFCFKQTVRIIRSLPTYYQLARSYIADGKLKQEIEDRIIDPIVKLRDQDHKEAAGELMAVLKERFTEKYIDFLEYIWPYYCRTVRFLKKMNFI